ncbi:MAG TPA: XRE family transcriptional regulator [Planctomycetes bacterium]|nr:XRE family transcriptional regulator [Planctomycetota bacterium]
MADKHVTGMTDREILALLGARLRALRKARKLKAGEVAELAGLNRGTVHRAEKGDNPTLLTVVRLLRVYGELARLEDFLAPPEISPMDWVRSRKGHDRG